MYEFLLARLGSDVYKGTLLAIKRILEMFLCIDIIVWKDDEQKFSLCTGSSDDSSQKVYHV